MRVKALCSKWDVTREQHDEASRIMDAAFAEVGIKVDRWWSDSEGQYLQHPPIEDRDLLERARSIAMQAVGIPFEWVEDEASLTGRSPK